MLFRYLFLALFFFFIHFSLFSQSLPPFKGLRFDEDYTFLKKDSVKKKFYRKLKYVPLNKNGSAYLSFGGELRQEFDAYNNEDWGIRKLGHNNFHLQRYNLHADLHLGKQFRIFSQLRSALENGRKDGPRPIDQDNMNIQNLFVEYNFLYAANEKLYVRFGRQEMFYGSQRLIAVRDGPNLRFAFDAARISYNKNNVTLDALAASDIKVNTGIFDNKRSKEINLWGLYSTINFKRMPNTSIDLYYLGIHRANTKYEEGTGEETRHSAGLRLWNKPSVFTYNFEAIIQWGKFNSDNILAWTASSDIEYTINYKKRYATLLGLKTDVISGDGQLNDGKLGAFNALYPKTGYFGFDPQIGPANLIDVHPYIIQSVNEKIFFQLDALMYWRYSLLDGIYRPGGAFYLPGNSSKNRYIGTVYLGQATYEFNSFLTADVGMQYFNIGKFINDIGGKHSALLINTRLILKF
ncbi:alginate export family protein [Ferruginibacter paludis]|uniref:alginate export family protein n=1 Tax=Ferruginibacter paludis TaxID=1310417 RepID=UPI0025B3046A|nr:alginate export family protein [Ferruginibacter paludis]MDN3656067.1 alginate export family protein [Ferruginibacter paludis]